MTRSTRELKGNLGLQGLCPCSKPSEEAGDLKDPVSCHRVQKCSIIGQRWDDTKISYVCHTINFFNCICNQKKTLVLKLQHLPGVSNPVSSWLNELTSLTTLTTYFLSKQSFHFILLSINVFPTKGKAIWIPPGLRASYDVSSYFYHYHYHETTQYFCYYLNINNSSR